ncbi:DUF6331 family protein [Paracrocinitomix mangrovi]|uniref:DUF6331 family protein n=1 Tax=Paracrocinitomix mangrovi TaxID=2862509 RepID=UPI001C8DD9E8|nr:DUF6331 family protein [Paracrocinitomix mangrovi]UKN03487.1 DUF6331 family protein [Paracrocinitomix mangrovi]
MPNWTDGEDILIGEDEYISWINWDLDKVQVHDIDYLIDPKNKFWNSLETLCVAECCGLDAFDWTTENVTKAYLECDREELTKTLEDAINVIENRTENVVSSTRLNQLFDRHVFINLLKHLKKQCITL